MGNAEKFSYTYNDVEFKGSIEGKVAIIKSFEFKATDVTIPAFIQYNGSEIPVKKVSAYMSGANYYATSITIENGIEEIDNYCFNECRKLKDVYIPSSVLYIGKNAFRGNKYIEFHLESDIPIASLMNGKQIKIKGVGNKISQENLMANSQPSKISKSSHDDVDDKSGSSKKSKSNSNAKEKEKKSLSDIDIDIPVIKNAKNGNTFCIIIANEKYVDVADVEYAEHDGDIFKEYCIKTLNIPEKQIKQYTNASYTDMKRALNWIETIADIAGEESKIIFYYAGHGIPDEKEKAAYIIPSDGFPKDISTCFKLEDIYARLGKIEAKSVIVFMDACFSGVKRGSEDAIVASRGVALKHRKEMLSGNIIVFSAASGDESALAYHDKQHGMFTYFLLDNIRKTKGQTSFGELFDNISKAVRRNSMLENDKLQTPTINVSFNLKDNWKNMKL